MKHFLLLIFFALSCLGANVKMSELPLGNAATTGNLDSFPYVDATSNITKRLTLSSLISIPSLSNTFAPKANPVFTGSVTAPSFIGALTGNASTATALAANPTDCSANQYATAIAANGNLTCSSITGVSPVGSVMDYAGSTAPTGWLMLYGQAVSRTTYADLFAIIGTTYGSGDGSTTFNLPDFRGRGSVGKDDMGGSAANRVTSAGSGIDGVALGASGGSQNVTLTTTEMPVHTHIQNAHTHTQNSHNHTQDAHRHDIVGNDNGVYQGGGNSGALTGNYMTYAGTGNTNRFVNSLTTATNQAATATNQNTTAVNQDAGGGGAHQNMQPTLVLNKIIKY